MSAKKLWVLIAVAIFASLIGTISLCGTLPQTPQTGNWVTLGNMATPRAGAVATLLKNGTVLITGGTSGSGPLASTEFVDASGNFSSGPSMHYARANHTATLLRDGRLLVVGGIGPDGSAIPTAEIFDPSSKSWSDAGSLQQSRAGHTATLLLDGRVVIAGGAASGTSLSSVEIFLPQSATFTLASSVLCSPRAAHGAALLRDGRVLIVGGSDGTNPLASSDIYDPLSDSIAAGPVLSVARQGLSITALLDGRVLAAGGQTTPRGGNAQDLASVEIADAAATAFTVAQSSLSAPRSGHQAFLLPLNNNVLIVGGTSAGAPIASAQLFTPWAGQFSVTGNLATARLAAAGAPLSANGWLLVTGGSDGTNSLSSAEGYSFPTVKTDRADYSPGSTVTITGSGWLPGETVTLALMESPLKDTPGPFTAVVDASGNFSSSAFATDANDKSVTFTVTAAGLTSGYQAQTTFTDGGTVTISGFIYRCPGATSGECRTPIPGMTVWCAATDGCTNSPPASTTSDASGFYAFDGQSGHGPVLTFDQGVVDGMIQLEFGAPGYCTSIEYLPATTASYSLNLTSTPCATMALSSYPNPSVYGQSVTLQASLTGLFGTPTGTVTFQTPGNSSTLITLGTASVTNGVANFTTSALPAPADDINFSYSGDSTYLGVQYDYWMQTVNQASTTIAGATVTPEPSYTGQLYTVSFSLTVNPPGAGSPTGTVTISDGTGAYCYASPGSPSCSLASATVGTKTITITYAGDNNFSGSSASVTHTVSIAATTTNVTSSSATATYGNPVTFTATVTTPSGAPSGVVTFYDSSSCAGNVLASAVALNSNGRAVFSTSQLVVGVHTITACYSSTGNYLASSASTSVTVSQAMPVITWLVPWPIIYGTPLGPSQLDATANVPGTFTYSPPSGTVLSAGNQSLSVTFAPTDTTDYTTSSATVTLVVAPVGQAPAIISANSTTFQEGLASSFAVTATGVPQPTITETGTLPSGVTFNSFTGVLSGTPDFGTAGTYNITFTAHNPISPDATQSFTLSVANVHLYLNDVAKKQVLAYNWDGTTLTALSPASFSYAGVTGVTFGSGIGLPGMRSMLVSGGYLYLGNGAEGSIISFPINADGKLGTPQRATFPDNSFGDYNMALAATPDGTTVFAGGNRTINAYTASAGILTKTGVFNTTNYVQNLALSQDATRLAYITESTTGMLDTSTFLPVGSLVSVNGGTDLTFACTDSRLYTSAEDGLAFVTANPSTGLGSTTRISTALYSTILSTSDGHYVYAATVPSTGSGAGFVINGFVAQSNGSLSAFASPAYNFVPNQWAYTLQLTPDGNVVARTNTPNLDAFGINGQGALTLSSSLSSVASAVATSPVATCVQYSATTTTVSAPTATYGAASVTVTVTSSTGVPTGTVTLDLTQNGAAVTGSPFTGTLTNGSVTFALPNLAVGSYALTGTFAQQNGFAGSSDSTQTLTVNQATPTVSWTTPAAIPYGTALSATQLDATASVPGTFVYNPSAGTVLGSGSQTLAVTFTPTDTTDYTTATGSVVLTVNPAAPTIGWAPPAAITYGTALGAAQLDATANVPGTFRYSPAAGTVLTAGSQTLSVTFTPTDSTDFTTATTSVTLLVNQVTPAIIWATPAAITYGAALSGTQLNASSAVAGTFSYSPAAGVVLGAGNQTLTATFTPTDSTDYTIAKASVTLVVNQATPVITWSAPTAITYGTALSSTQLDATANVSGAWTYSPAAGAVLGAGSQTLNVTFTPTDTTDYTNATSSVTLTVNKATPAITWVTPAPITYGTALSSTQLDATANVPGTFAYSPAASAILGAGSQMLNVTFTPTDTTDYTNATSTVTLTVNKATPVITWAPPAAIAYGTPLSPTQLDANANVPGTYAYTPAAGALLSVGSQTLSVAFTPNDTNNYISTTSTVTLSVTQAASAISLATSQSPALYGSVVVLTATVTDASPGSTGTPTGTVSFYIGSVLIGTGPLNAGVTTLVTATLPPGTDSITGVYTGDPNFTSNSNSLLQTVTAVPVVSISPDATTFAPQNVNTTSVPMPIVLTNIGTAPLTLSSIQISGNDSTSFAILSNTCATGVNALAAGGSCTVNVVFTPTDTGDRMSSLVFTDNDGGAVNPVTQVIGLVGSSVSTSKTNFTRQSIAAGNTIWFNSVLSLKGPHGPDGHELDMSQNKVQIFVTEATVAFSSGGQTYNLAVPDGKIILDPTVTTATTTFDGTQWVTTVPAVAPPNRIQQFDVGGEIFATGLPWQVPAGGLPGGIQNVSWSAAYSTDTPGIALNWEWGAAVYTSLFITTPGTYNGLGVKPIDDQRGPCNFQNSTKNPAGTPENFKAYWVLGATGDDPGDYVGDWTRDTGVIPSVNPVSVDPYPLVFAPILAGSSSSAALVTVTNNNASLSANVAGVTVTDSAEFSVTPATGPCTVGSFVLPPSSSCTFSVVFTPTGIGTSTATMTFTFSPPAGMAMDEVPAPITLDMVGTGMGGANPFAALSVLTLKFPRQMINTTSASQNVMLVNAGGKRLTGISVASNSGEFVITSNSCGSTLDPGASCMLAVTFTPSAIGSRTGTLTFTYANNSGAATQTVTMTGSGSAW